MRVLIEAAEIIDRAWARERRRQVLAGAAVLAVFAASAAVVLFVVAWVAAGLMGIIQ